MSNPRIIHVKITPAHGLTPEHFDFHSEGFASDEELLLALKKCYQGILERRKAPPAPLGSPNNIVTLPTAELLDPLGAILNQGR
jgi:hypothetical protein